MRRRFAGDTKANQCRSATGMASTKRVQKTFETSPNAPKGRPFSDVTDNVKSRRNSTRSDPLDADTCARGSTAHTVTDHANSLPHQVCRVEHRKYGNARPISQTKRHSLGRLGVRRSEVVQRLIGFEFQTVSGNPNIEDINSNEISEPVVESDGWKLEPDGKDLEYITEPLSQDRSSDRRALEVAKDIVKAHDRIFSEKKIAGWSKPKPSDAKNHGKNEDWFQLDKGERSILVNSDGQRNAHPQATIGLKLEAIFSFLKDWKANSSNDLEKGDDEQGELWETVGWGNHGADKKRFKENPSSIIGEKYINKGTSEAVKGLLEIIRWGLEIVNDGSMAGSSEPKARELNNFLSGLGNHEAMETDDNERGAKKFAKDTQPLMMRSALREVADSLKEEEKEELIGGLAAYGIDSVFAEGLGERITINDIIEWVNGREVDSPSGMFTGNALGSPEGAPKGFKPSTDIEIGTNGQPIKGAVFEMRYMGRSVEPAKWPHVVLATRELVRIYNGVKKATKHSSGLRYSAAQKPRRKHAGSDPRKLLDTAAPKILGKMHIPYEPPKRNRRTNKLDLPGWRTKFQFINEQLGTRVENAPKPRLRKRKSKKRNDEVKAAASKRRARFSRPKNFDSAEFKAILEKLSFRNKPRLGDNRTKPAAPKKRHYFSNLKKNEKTQAEERPKRHAHYSKSKQRSKRMKSAAPSYPLFPKAGQHRAATIAELLDKHLRRPKSKNRKKRKKGKKRNGSKAT